MHNLSSEPAALFKLYVLLSALGPKQADSARISPALQPPRHSSARALIGLIETLEKQDKC